MKIPTKKPREFFDSDILNNPTNVAKAERSTKVLYEKLSYIER